MFLIGSREVKSTHILYDNNHNDHHQNNNNTKAEEAINIQSKCIFVKTF